MKNMRVLFIIDPVEKLELEWDNSLALVREMMARDHQCWSADTGDIYAETRRDFVRASRFVSVLTRAKKSYALPQENPKILKLDSFDLILVRKEPPFDLEYYYLTLILERVARSIPVSNDPAGIRNTNEKMSTLLFPQHAPRTIVSSSTAAIAEFQKKFGGPVVVKPLNEKGGHGVRLLWPARSFVKRLEQLTHHGRKTLMAQEFLAKHSGHEDKRIILLNGKIIASYEKHPPKNDFRTNLSLNGTSHPTKLTSAEINLANDLRTYLLKEGLHLVGIDVMAGKLIDLNVTCPAGMTVAKKLYPLLTPISAWADFLEKLRPKRCPSHQ
jgi:glutathione synthase